MGAASKIAKNHEKLRLAQLQEENKRLLQTVDELKAELQKTADKLVAVYESDINIKDMTIRDLMNVLPFWDRDIFIKPNGCEMYYRGEIADVPEYLRPRVVKEIIPQIYPADEISNRKFEWGIGVYIDSIPDNEMPKNSRL